MKSKKKLVYKLHDNIQSNPYKHVSEHSRRSTGVKIYDFNKLRSNRANSLINSSASKELLSARDSPAKNETECAKALIEEYRDRVKAAYSTVITEKTDKRSHEFGSNKIKMSANMFDVLQKKINIRKNKEGASSPEKYSEKQRELMQLCENQPQLAALIRELLLSRYPQLTKLPLQNSAAKIQSTNSPREKKKDQVQSSEINSALGLNGHKRQISLPLIHQKGQGQTSRNDAGYVFNTKIINPIEESIAKKEVLRQIQGQKQSAINEEILKAIKKKSNRSLERLKVSQSHSELQKMDKWKEKYSRAHKQIKNELLPKKNNVIELPHLLLPLTDIQCRSSKADEATNLKEKTNEKKLKMGKKSEGVEDFSEGRSRWEGVYSLPNYSSELQSSHSAQKIFEPINRHHSQQFWGRISESQWFKVANRYENFESKKTQTFQQEQKESSQENRFKIHQDHQNLNLEQRNQQGDIQQTRQEDNRNNQGEKKQHPNNAEANFKTLKKTYYDEKKSEELKVFAKKSKILQNFARRTIEKFPFGFPGQQPIAEEVEQNANSILTKIIEGSPMQWENNENTQEDYYFGIFTKASQIERQMEVGVLKDSK